MDQQQQPRPVRTIVAWIAVTAILLGFLWLWNTRGDSVRFGQFHDDTIYFATAQAISQEGRVTLPSLPGEPDQTKYPPLYPFLLSLVWLVSPQFPGNLTAAAGISAMLGIATLIVAFVYLRGWKGVGPGAAVFIVALCASHDAFLLVFSAVVSETLFIFLAVSAFALGDAQDRRKTLLAGVIAGLSVLTRPIGIAVAGGIAFTYLWQRDRTRLAWFSAGFAPFLVLAASFKMILSAPVPDGAPEGFRQTWLYYLDHIGFWRLSVPDLETLVGMLNVNVVEMLAAPAAVTIGSAPGGFLLTLVWITLSAGILAGVFRQARADRLRAPHVALILHAPFVLLWNYEIGTRLLLTFQWVFAMGLWIEGGYLIRTFIRNLKGGRALADRLVSATGLVIVSVLAIYAVSAKVERQAAAVAKHPDSFQDLYQDVYQWVERNTHPEDRFLAIDDVYLFLQTGRQAIWPLALTTEPRFRPDESRLEDQMSRIGDVAEHIDADYLIWTEHDYAYAPPMKERWGVWAESWPLLMSRDDGKVKVFKLQRKPQELPGS